MERSEKPGSLGKQATRRQLPVLSLLSFFKEDTIGDWNVFQVRFLSFVLGALVQDGFFTFTYMFLFSFFDELISSLYVFFSIY